MQVPLTLMQPISAAGTIPRPTLLTVYGAYGHSLETDWSSEHLALLSLKNGALGISPFLLPLHSPQAGTLPGPMCVVAVSVVGPGTWPPPNSTSAAPLRTSSLPFVVSTPLLSISLSPRVVSSSTTG